MRTFVATRGDLVLTVGERPFQGRVRRFGMSYTALKGPLFHRRPNHGFSRWPLNRSEKSLEIDFPRRETIRIQPTLAENVCRPNHRVLRVRPSLALETQRVFEIKRDHRRLRVLQHEVTQRADRNLLRNLLPVVFRQLAIPRIHFLLCRRNQRVEQIVGFHPESLAPTDAYEGPRLVFFGQVVANLGRAAWSQHDHPVGQVREMVGSFTVTQIA